MRSAEVDPCLAESDQVGWYAAPDLPALGATDEIQAWAHRALDALGSTC